MVTEVLVSVAMVLVVTKSGASRKGGGTTESVSHVFLVIVAIMMGSLR